MQQSGRKFLTWLHNKNQKCTKASAMIGSYLNSTGCFAWSSHTLFKRKGFVKKRVVMQWYRYVADIGCNSKRPSQSPV